MVAKKNSKTKKKLTSSEIMERVIDVEELEKRKQTLIKEEAFSKTGCALHFWILLILFVSMCFLSFGFGSHLSSFYFWTILCLILLFIPFYIVMKLREDHLQSLENLDSQFQWMAFRNMIESIPNFNQAELESVVLWNRILVYATLYGQAKKVSQVLQSHQISVPYAQLLRTGNLKDSDWEKLIEGAGTIGRSNLIIDDTPGISISEMRSKCRKYKMEHNLELIIIDYLQLMSGSVGGRNESRQQEISDISRSLKALARELSVPVIALSQLSRAVEQRPDHRPMLSDLRESGAIEQDADVVMFIYRDDYYNKDTEHVNEAEIIIAKQRNGPIGTVTLTWLPQYTKFANSERKVVDGE